MHVDIGELARAEEGAGGVNRVVFPVVELGEVAPPVNVFFAVEYVVRREELTLVREALLCG